MSANTQGYYEDRSRKARELAAAAVDPKIAAIHMEMAERYDRLASASARAPTGKPPLRIVRR